MGIAEDYAGVAQLVERFTCNEDVAGSNPVSSLCPCSSVGRAVAF